MHRGVPLLIIMLGVMASGVSCEKLEIDDLVSYKTPYNLNRLCDKLNHNIIFYTGLVRTYSERRVVDLITMESEKESSVTYNFSFDGSISTQYYSFSDDELFVIPHVSFYRDGDFYYWEVNGRKIKDEDGNLVAMNDVERKPLFRIKNTSWQITVDGKNWHDVLHCPSEYNIPQITLSSKGDFVVCDVNDTLQIIVPTNNLNNTIKKNVPIQGFYKDIFMDAGVYLTSFNSLAAASFLGYSLESVTCTNIADTLWQNAVIGGNGDDENGRLLYPDGAPRYKILFVCGGSSKSHGKTLRSKSRENMRTFVRNGGAYVGTCAGAFLVSNGYDTVDNYPYYLHLWPGVVNHTGLVQTSTGMFIEKGSPLLRYYSFGGDNYVKDIRHNKGGMPSSLPYGTEILARYDYPSMASMHGQPSAWAYKKDNKQGRIIMEGSHPEEVSTGERRDFTAALLCYAADGVGETSIKGLLRNGEVRVMDKTTGEKKAAYTRIGDMQYHHFAVYIPKDAKNIKFTVSSEIDCDLQLCLHRTTFAYSNIAEYKSKENGHNQELLFDGMTEGLWYVAVQCLTTVIATNVPLGQEYSGRADVLNGVPYTIGVRWDCDGRTENR